VLGASGPQFQTTKIDPESLGNQRNRPRIVWNIAPNIFGGLRNLKDLVDPRFIGPDKFCHVHVVPPQGPVDRNFLSRQSKANAGSPDWVAGIEGDGPGGYAGEMSPEYQAKQAVLTGEHIKKQDIVITTALIPGRAAPVLVTADQVATMKPGSVIVDLAVENGGNVEGGRGAQGNGGQRRTPAARRCWAVSVFHNAMITPSAAALLHGESFCSPTLITWQ